MTTPQQGMPPDMTTAQSGDRHAREVVAYVAVGSNLGNRDATIAAVLDDLAQLQGIVVRRRSRLIETEPVGPPPQGRYLNGVVEIETTSAPRPLLGLLHEIERRHGRIRTAGDRNGPRTIDLDLILYGQAIIDEPGLTIPHPRFHDRLFVLEPLAELAPAVIHPRLGKSVESLLVFLRGNAGRTGCLPLVADAPDTRFQTHQGHPGPPSA